MESLCRCVFLELKIENDRTDMYIGNNVSIMTPCISKCEFDSNDICKGCYRNTSEVTDWVNKSEEERLSITIRCKKMIARQQELGLYDN